MRAIVTGASPGIGGAICLKLAGDARSAGSRAQLAISATASSGRFSDLASNLRSLGADVLTFTGDLGHPEMASAMVEKAADAFGGLDALVSNAAMTAAARLVDLDLESWEKTFHVNTRATWLLAKSAFPALKRSKGSVLAIASMSGMHPHPGTGAYSPSKAALIMLCQVMAQEWAEDGVRVNVISPGLTRTPMTEQIYRDEETARRRLELVPQHRIGLPGDVANAAAFLLSPGASYMTGQNLCIDGGLTQSVLSRIPGLPPPSAVDRP